MNIPNPFTPHSSIRISAPRLMVWKLPSFCHCGCNQNQEVLYHHSGGSSKRSNWRASTLSAWFNPRPHSREMAEVTHSSCRRIPVKK
jgi:hypothetical protein